jgi:hypothetical protein
MLLVAIFATIATFSQKSKMNVSNTPAVPIQISYACPAHSSSGMYSKCNTDFFMSKKEQMKREVMKIYTCPMHTIVINASVNKCPQCIAKTFIDRRSSKQAITTYSCLMNSGEIRCPICNMNEAVAMR